MSSFRDIRVADKMVAKITFLEIEPKTFHPNTYSLRIGALSPEDAGKLLALPLGTQHRCQLGYSYSEEEMSKEDGKEFHLKCAEGI